MSVSFSLILASALAFADPDPAPHFETEILPVLTKAGCNAGSCHGAAAGRGGFHLSLWGSDPDADYHAIVHEFEGRRVNPVHPEQSLILRKPTGEINHEGGLPLPGDSEGAERLTHWIAAGMPRGKPRTLREFSVSPSTQVVKTNEPIPLLAKAEFAGEAAIDVTRWTVWKPADPSAVTIHPKHVTATVHRPGQHVMIARFLDRVVPIQLLVPYGSEPVDLSGESRENFIDDFVLKRLEDLQLPLSPPADSATFIRRVTLDLTGRLPEQNTIERFIQQEQQQQSPADRSAHRRKAIDRLLQSDEFTEYWAFRLSEWLRVGGQKGQLERAKVFHEWIREQLRKKTPLDEMARQLLTANGDPLQYGPANFYLVAGDARGQAEYVSETFLGVRLRCANCHNHPLDRWTQDDYHGFAAVFARVDRSGEIRQKSFGNVIHPKTGEPAMPRIPGTRNLESKADLRTSVAEWLTAPENAYFSRALVNRLWQAMMGRGLVHPADDLSKTNPATHPELLDALAADFVEHGFDLRHTLRRIALSRAYQRSSQSVGINRLDDLFYSRQASRPLPAEVLIDAWCDVTGVPEHYPDTPLGTRAIALVSPFVDSRSLDALGRCDRAGDCGGGSSPGITSNLAAKLHVLNGGILNDKIPAKSGRLHSLLRASASDEKIIEEFYLRALSRHPTSKELEHWQKQFGAHAENGSRHEVCEDFLWSLLTCQEFRTNH